MGKHFAFMIFGWLFFASQIFWIIQIRRFGSRLIPNKTVRRVLAIIGGAVYIFLLVYNFMSAREVAATSLTESEKRRCETSLEQRGLVEAKEGHRNKGGGPFVLHGAAKISFQYGRRRRRGSACSLRLRFHFRPRRI